MVSRSKDGTHKFSIKGKGYEMFFAEDGYSEIYETDNPGKTGFIFSDIKNLTLFINNITDLAGTKLNKE